MKRAAIGSFFACCALTGALVASLAAGPVTAAVGTTGTTTTTAPPPTTDPDPILADGVTIGGISVGRIPASAAVSVVRTAFEAPVVLVFDGHTLQPSPEDLGAVAYVQPAVERAKLAAPGAEVPLVVRVRGERVRAYVAKLAKRFDRTAIDARVVLRRLRPFVSKGRAGRRLDRPAIVKSIVDALVENRRFPIELAAKSVAPKVTRKTFGPVIVIRRGSNRLYLYDAMRLRRVFGVATGQDRYPTPLGRFSIVVMWKNPWWYPPDSDWAEGQKPIPPGPGNPLGTRWMGLSSPGVGIHGTPDAGSIGYSVSHGCIRMQIPHAEWLFRRVEVGTPVFIVGT